jgi:simple sugar transport system permease protein
VSSRVAQDPHATVVKAESLSLTTRRKRLDNLILVVRELLLRPELAALIGLIATLVVFSFLSPLFWTKLTWITIASSASELGIVAVCVTVLMIGGNFDLSIGSVVGFSGYVLLYALKSGLPPPVAVLVALGSGMLIGAVNGSIVIATRIHSFIITLGMQLIVRSILSVVVQGTTAHLEMDPRWEQWLAGPNLAGFRMSLVWFVLLAFVATAFLLRTKAGNWAYAMGQNKEAARNLGVPVGALTIFLFMVSGFGAALLGVVEAARFDSVDATRGIGLEFYVIIVVVVGGASLFGGYGSALGTLLGSIFYGVLQAGLVLSRAPGYYFDGFIGAGLFIAVFLNQWFLGRVERFSWTAEPVISTESPSIAIDTAVEEADASR